MILIKNRQIVLLFLGCIMYVASQAQTLYWVGGSGNFNDQKHWSLSSGGISTNLIPNSNTDVVFDDNSSNSSFSVLFALSGSCKSLKFYNDKVSIDLKGDKLSELYIGGDFLLNDKVRSNFKTKLLFKQEVYTSSRATIDFYGKTLDSDVDFINGEWNLKAFSLSDVNIVRFLSGRFYIEKTYLKVGSFISNNGKVLFFTDLSSITAKNKFNIGGKTKFTSKSTLFDVNKDSEGYTVDSLINFGASSKVIGGGGNVVTACGVTLTSQNPVCGSSNDGKLFVSVDAGCSGTYTLQFLSGCSPPANSTVVAGGTYTFSNFAGCGSSYQVVLLSGVVPVAFSGLALITAPTPVTFFPFSPINPSCFGLCNGSFMASWTAGNLPLTIVHSPPSQPQYTTSGVTNTVLTYSSLCTGINTFSVTDNNGCTSVHTYSLGQPSTLTAVAVTTSVSCLSFTNGSYAISPLGGTPNYTVNFSIGGVQTTGSLGTVTSVPLAAGPITATITDANGCSAIVSTVIAEPSTSLSVVVSTVGLLCNGVCTGSASALASGGTSPYTYSWTSNPSTISTATGYCASVGTETLTVKDFNNCSNSSQTFVITQPSPITVPPPTLINVICPGGSTGGATLTPSGGTGPYSYTWTAPGPPALIGSVSSQTNLLSFVAPYTVTVKDANSCTTTPVLFTITQPSAVTLAITTKSVDCFLASTGGATVVASGGNNTSYTYTWMPGGFNASVTPGLPTGTYVLTVADASNCITSTNVVITGPTVGISPSTTFTNQSCNIANAACNGIINASPTGGSPPYTYTLASAGAPVFTAPPYLGLCSGTYTVFVGSSTGLCPVSSIITLTTPAALNPNIVINTPIPCFGSSLGGLTGSPGAGGTPTYALTWVAPTGTIPGNPTSISSLTAGVYTMIVTDSKSCTALTSINLTQPSSITIAVAASSISCFSGTNGIITSTVSGGSPAYGFAWTNSLSVNVGTTSTASGLAPGPYTLTVTDASLCASTKTAAILSPPPITLTAASAPVKCFGDSNGSVTLTASGGTTPYNPTYTLSNGGFPILSSGTTTNLVASNYTATMNDANGCTQTTTFAITSPTALAAAITGTGSCSVCSGSASVIPSFGNSPYSVLWTSSSGTFVAITTTITSLCPANYSVTVTDFKGCTTSTNITISQIVNISINPGAASILCFGATTGSASTLPGGGTPPYTYAWTPTIQTTQTLTNVGAGTYTVQVTDSSSPIACSHTAAITLTAPPAMTVTSTQTNVTCFSFTNGAITTTVAGGVGPYTQTWTPTGLLTSGLSGIAANVYTINIRDANLCPAAKTISITESPSITISLAITNPTGCVAALANGSICATASGGSGAGYSYTITGPATNSTNVSGCFSGLGAGTYSIVVTDGALCSNSTFTTLNAPLSPTVTVSSVPVACYGFSTGVASATVVGATPTFTISWLPAVTFTANASGSLTSASNLPQGTYFVNAIDGNGCAKSQSIGVTQAASVTINGNSSNLTCNTISTGSITVAPTGGTPGTPSYTYAWIPAASITSGQSTGTVTGLAAGIYTLNLLDANLCSTPHTFTLTEPPAITLTAITSSVRCNSNCTGSIVANATGGTGSLNYSWTPIGGNTATVTNLCANTGTNPVSYTVTITDANNCVKSNTYVITQPSALTSTVGFVSASCSNSCNAVATNSVSGGTSAYTYSWSGSAATTSTLGALCSGTHVATVTDANGCVLANVFTITPTTPLSLTLTPVNPLCNAACNGSITTIVSGAQGAVTFSWSPAGSGQSPTGLCATPNPNYTLVAKDQNSCEVTAVTTLTNPPALLTGVSHTNPLCHDDANGIATVSFTNAVGATSYTWLPTGPPTQTSQTATGLTAGNYTVTVMDNNLCQGSTSFSVTNPSTISPNASIGASSCSLSVGQIILNPTGGTPGSPTAYTYSWSAPLTSSASSVFSLFAGSYTVLITDANGCTTTTNLPVSDSNGPNVIPILSSSINCNAQCTGAATVDLVNVSGGTFPYTAIWTNPTSTTSIVNNLCAGIYNAQVTDANNCIGNATVNIAEPPPIVNAPSIGFPLCAGVCDGTIALNTSGGNSPYTYTWAPVSSNSPTLANLCGGNYTVIVGYNSTCADTSIVSIPVQTSLSIVPTVTDNLCFGNCNGAVNLNLSGGSSPYTISWSNSQTSQNISGLCNGTYSVSVVDNNGCINTQTTAVTSGAQITASTSVFSPSCGLCNGTASIAVSGGISPFTYSWSNSATSAAVSSLCAGVYQVIVTDNNLCSQTETVIINNSNGITGETINVQQIPCSGSCVGAATVSAIGGNPPIAYNWVSPATTNSVISNLCPGTYFVQMVDAQNCVRIASVNIDPQVTLSVSPFVHLPLCGSTTGSISIVIAGGTPSYSIVWNPPAGNTTSLTGLGAGVYSYTVTESGTNSCSVSQAINMSNSNGPVIAATQRNIDCFGVCSGSISTIVTSTATPLTYSWSTGASSSTLNALTNLCKGIITLTVSDINLCKAIQSFTITDNPLLQLGFTNVQSPLCLGDCNGSIDLIPNGGTLPYHYLWSFSSSTLNPLTSLCDGTYSASVTDAKGCIVNSPPFVIKSTSSMTLSANSFNSSCSSVANGSISVTPSGGVAAYSYLWNGPSSFTSTSQNLSNIFNGSYTVTVTDNLNCQRDSVFLIVPTLTVVADAGNNNTICPETGSVVLVAQGSGGSLTYKWFMYPDTINSISNNITYTVANLFEPAIFKLLVTSSVATCYASDLVRVDLFFAPTINITNFHQIPIYTSVTLGGNPTTQSGNTLTWTPSVSLNDPNAFNPTASNTVNTTFTLTVMDMNGCTAWDTVQVLLYPEIKVTSGFTPNGDGKNDLWLIDYLEQFPDNTVEIFNRWGDRIFSSTGYNEPFDGKYKGKDLPVGTYYYVINVNHPGYPKAITGPLTIFR